MSEEYKMSPLGEILMSVLRKGTWAAAALILSFAGILLFQRRTPSGSIQLQEGDMAFLGVLAVLLLLAVYLIRGIKKELENPGK